MPDAPPPPHPWAWNRRNLAALALVVAVMGLVIGVRLARQPLRLDSDLTVTRAPLNPADERIDPNTATWPSLARLPGIGPGRAKAILAYRESFAATQPDRPAFLTPDDLQAVSGIGPATVAGITPFLTFGPEPTLEAVD